MTPVFAAVPLQRNKHARCHSEVYDAIQHRHPTVAVLDVSINRPASQHNRFIPAQIGLFLAALLLALAWCAIAP
jgi:hypothetical protein